MSGERVSACDGVDSADDAVSWGLPPAATTTPAAGTALAADGAGLLCREEAGVRPAAGPRSTGAAAALGADEDDEEDATDGDAWR